MNWIDELNQIGKNRKPCFFIIDYLGEKAKIYEIDNLDEKEIKFDFNIDYLPNYEQNNSCEFQLKPNLLPYEEFETAFQKIKNGINYGDSYLANLTFSTSIETNKSLNEIYQLAKAKYKILYKNQWVCFSPETFVRIKENKIFTYPMKGTIDADLPNAEEKLIENIKEKAEHYTIVDLLRNDLSQIAKNVSVEKFRYIEKIIKHNGSILQASSEIKGDLSADWHDNLGNIFKKLLPAGSISGAPKKQTLKLIEKAETHKRGYYTGVAAYYDGKSLESCVLIRFIENTSKGLVFKSGGGITALSNPKDEYQEIKQKIYVPIH